MRDPHIIISAFIEKRRRDQKQVLALIAYEIKHGGWEARVVVLDRPEVSVAVGHSANLDGALQALVKTIDNAEHVRIEASKGILR